MNPNKKVLIVDDEQDIVEILSYNLSKQNLDVRRAYSGRECISVAKQFHPDLIVMDIRMPETNGIEACRILKHDDELKDIPVLFLTADSDTYTAMSAMMAGGNHYLTKPIAIAVLTDIIKTMIYGKKYGVPDGIV
jgi:two-component system alkaline phosphatase synthesis response regulator PhoP